jgi:ribose/xylose/arabinose/galactoside ABC-type transport system permease subunit
VTKLKRFLLDYNIVIVLAAIITYAFFFVPYFNVPKNISNVLVDTAVFGLICIGMSFCLINGGVDLSIGLQAALSACIVCYVGSKYNLALGIIAAVVSCMIVGFLNGYIIARFKLGSLITTLAMMRILYGLILIITNEDQIVNTNESLLMIYKYKLFGVIQLPIVIFVVCLLLGSFILRKTQLGINLYIVGGNMEAGKAVGINVQRTQILAYVIGSFFAGVGGVVLAARYGMGSTMVGDGLNLTVVSACVVGGVSILGGKGNMLRTMLGILVMRIVINVMVLKLINGYMQSFVQGIIIVLVLIADLLTSYKKSAVQ